MRAPLLCAVPIRGAKRGAKRSESEGTSGSPKPLENAEFDLGRRRSLSLWSRWSPVRVRSLTPHEGPPNGGAVRRRELRGGQSDSDSASCLPRCILASRSKRRNGRAVRSASTAGFWAICHLRHPHFPGGSGHGGYQPTTPESRCPTPAARRLRGHPPSRCGASLGRPWPSRMTLTCQGSLRYSHVSYRPTPVNQERDFLEAAGH
jgi:hypothetical protein